MATDTTRTAFEYDRFRSLAGSDLVGYMEPLLGDPEVIVSPDDLRRMAAELDHYDEYHLVYAIELGVERMPSVFGPSAARCLTHECQSVRLAAHRHLLRLPPSTVSDELIGACERAVEAPGRYEDVSDIVERLRRVKKEGLN